MLTAFTASTGSPTRILGIDPGTVHLGYGVIERTGAGPAGWRTVECGVVAAPARKPRPERLGLLGATLREILVELRPESVAMEEAFFGANVASALALGEARGVAIYVVAQAGLRVAGYPPATVKKVVAGHGSARKEQIGFMVRSILSMRRAPEPDAADALAVALCHARQIRAVRTTGVGVSMRGGPARVRKRA